MFVLAATTILLCLPHGIISCGEQHRQRVRGKNFNEGKESVGEDHGEDFGEEMSFEEGGNFNAASVRGGIKGRQCGFISPSLEEKQIIEKNMEQYRKERGPYNQEALTRINIPVHFHIIMKESTGEGDVTERQIDKQVDVLNRAFSGNDSSCNGARDGYECSDAKVTFTKAGVNRIANDDWFDLGIQEYEFEVKRTHQVGDCSKLNVYIGHAGGKLGWAYYPHWVCGTRDEFKDGVVVDYRSLPEGSFGGYNLGDTLTHEVGHWFGLYHTFDGGCDDGDFVADTPAEESPNYYTCEPGTKDSCSSAGFDPVENFMDYASDSCMYRFTPGQIERLRAQYDIYRS